LRGNPNKKAFFLFFGFRRFLIDFTGFLFGFPEFLFGFPGFV
jgi:hypothetical protein